MESTSDSSTGRQQLKNEDENGEAKQPFFSRIKTRFLHFIKSFGLFLYNKEKKAICGGTPLEWIKTSTYYFFFYICLGLYFAGMVAVFAAIVSRSEPTYYGTSSRISDSGIVNVGMGFRPMPDITKTSITVYNDTSSQVKMVNSITTYRIQFYTQYNPTYLEECSPSYPASSLQGDHSCKFSWTDIVPSESHPCSTTNMYGWPVGQPCVLIKLNNIYGWLPADGDVTSQVTNATGQPILPIDKQEKNIYITCNGVSASDTQLMGNLTYYSLLHPEGISGYGGIPYYFFPFRNTRDQAIPFVLVRFTSLALEQKVNVICRAWAPNIAQLSEGTTLRGVIAFDIFRSNNKAPVQ